MINIAVDCFGGDHSPQANVCGSVMALEKFDNLHIIFSGDEKSITEELRKYKYDGKRIDIIDAPEIIGCDEKPTDAIRMKRNSSMMKAVLLLRNDDSVAGMVSTGSTGALVVAATVRVGRLRGVIRPAFCPVIPTMNGKMVGICDSGANVECDADELQQFAVMGTLYLEKVYGIDPAVSALLNVGTEAEKGDALRKEAYTLLMDTPDIHFNGNMESRDLLSGKYDLVICDGFSGNVLVKSTEGACLEILKRLKADALSSLSNKIGALFLKKTLMREKDFMNYQNYGGSVILGTKKVIVKGHGSAKETSVEKCIEQAYRMQLTGLNEIIEEKICALPSAKH